MKCIDCKAKNIFVIPLASSQLIGLEQVRTPEIEQCFVAAVAHVT